MPRKVSNETKIKTYVHAYEERLKRGERIGDIDADYLQRGRVSTVEINMIHSFLKKK